MKALGGLVNSSRTPEQTDIAYFFADNAFLTGTGPFRASLIPISTTLATVPGSSPSATWRWPMLAITAWDSKRHYRLLAAHYGHSGRRQRRQSPDGWRPDLAAADRHPDLS